MFYDTQSIQIAYNTLKYKFDYLYSDFENESIESNSKRIRILFLDLTFIFNFLFGYFLDYKNPNAIFDQRYLQIHVIEILNLISHYRRFFNHRIKANKNYVFIYRSHNNKQKNIIYDRIVDLLEDYCKFIPDIYINNTQNITRIYFKEIINQEFKLKYRNTDNIRAYILSNEDANKSLIYSYLNKSFINKDVLINGQYKNNKLIMKKYEDLIPEYNELFYNNDNLIRRKFRENYYKIIIMENSDKKLHRTKKINKAKKYLLLFSNKIDITELIEKESYEAYLAVLQYIESENAKYANLVKQILKTEEINLFDKTLYTINETLADQNIRLNIEWLLNIE